MSVAVAVVGSELWWFALVLHEHLIGPENHITHWHGSGLLAMNAQPCPALGADPRPWRCRKCARPICTSGPFFSFGLSDFDNYG